MGNGSVSKVGGQGADVRTARSRVTKWWPKVAQAVILTVLSVVFGRTVLANWSAVNKAVADLNWLLFGASIAMLTLSFSLLPLGSLLSLRALGVKIRYSESYHAYFLSQMAKYLPGGIWVFPGRVYLYRQIGLDVWSGSVGLLWEIVAVVASSSMVSLLVLVYPRGRYDQQAMSLLQWPALAAVLTLLITVFVSPKGLAKLLGRSRLALFRSFPPLDTLQWATGRQAVAGLVALFVGMWGAVGLAFYQLLRALYPATSGDALLPAIGIFAGAWVVGFLSFVVPAGAGVREGALALMLAPILPQPYPVLASLLARVWWTAAELTCLAVSFLMVAATRRCQGGVDQDGQ